MRPLFSRDDTLIVMVFISVLASGYSISAQYARSEKSDHLRYVRCALYDKPMATALDTLFRDLDADVEILGNEVPERNRWKAAMHRDFKTYAAAVKGKINGPCGDIPQARENGVLP